MDLVGMLWDASPLFMSRAEFEKTLEGWTLEPMHNERGEVALIFASRGPAFHFAKVDPDYRPSVAETRAILAKYPGSLIERHGYATTSTPKTDARQIRLNLRLGFRVTGEDEYDIHQRIDAMR